MRREFQTQWRTQSVAKAIRLPQAPDRQTFPVTCWGCSEYQWTSVTMPSKSFAMMQTRFQAWYNLWSIKTKREVKWSVLWVSLPSASIASTPTLQVLASNQSLEPIYQLQGQVFTLQINFEKACVFAMKLLRLPFSLLLLVILPFLTFSTASTSHLVLDELSSRLINNAFRQADFVPKAIVVLDSLKSSPSCARLVFQGLMAECQSLERSTGLEIALEETKSQYAITLAICEIAAADVITPTECERFIPSKREPRKGQYNPTHMHESKRCLHALHSRQQWWTSYSNNLQNVVVVCEASRSMVERGKQCWLIFWMHRR